MVAQAFWLVLFVASMMGALALESANCTDRSYNWVSVSGDEHGYRLNLGAQMFDAQGQSPCYIAEQLADVCNPGGKFRGPQIKRSNTMAFRFQESL